MADNEQDKRVLRTSVYAGGQWWKAGSTPPDDIAGKITNPKAWTTATDEEADQADKAANAGTSTGARLARRVTVGGAWYGPDDPIPDEVAAKVRNPKAWEGGELPTLPTASASTATGDQGGAPTADRTGGDGGDNPTGTDPAPAGDSTTQTGGDTPATEQKTPRKAAPVKRS